MSQRLDADLVEAALSGTLSITGLPQDISMTARAVQKMADALDEIHNGKLTERAVVLLIHDATGLPKGNIKKLLECGPRLRQYYLKPEKK